MKTRPTSRSSSSRRRRPRGWLVLAALGTVGAVVLLFANGQQPASAQPEIPSGYDLPSWYENGHDGQYLLQLADGMLPPKGVRVSGVVLSDTNCEPDAQGLNHCHNGIRLADGTTITVIDNHMMSRNRCLQPGETVSLATFNKAWLVAWTAEAGSAE